MCVNEMVHTKEKQKMLYSCLVDMQEQADVKQTSSVKAALMHLGLDFSRLSLNLVLWG